MTKTWRMSDSEKDGRGRLVVVVGADVVVEKLGELVVAADLFAPVEHPAMRVAANARAVATQATRRFCRSGESRLAWGWSIPASDQIWRDEGGQVPELPVTTAYAQVNGLKMIGGFGAKHL
jgi:hypothetical protein